MPQHVRLAPAFNERRESTPATTPRLDTRTRLATYQPAIASTEEQMSKEPLVQGCAQWNHRRFATGFAVGNGRCVPRGEANQTARRRWGDQKQGHGYRSETSKRKEGNFNGSSVI